MSLFPSLLLGWLYIPYFPSDNILYRQASERWLILYTMSNSSLCQKEFYSHRCALIAWKWSLKFFGIWRFYPKCNHFIKGIILSGLAFKILTHCCGGFFNVSQQCVCHFEGLSILHDGTYGFNFSTKCFHPGVSGKYPKVKTMYRIFVLKKIDVLNIERIAHTGSDFL